MEREKKDNQKHGEQVGQDRKPMQQKQQAASEELFWADQLAETIINRKKFHYLDKPVPKFKEFVVKTSASLSGVLHIGRLSDTVRGYSVYKALIDKGVKAKLIWVAENMDPLRKVPQNVPKNFAEYIGTSVSDVPDPEKCHDSYADHFMLEYFEVLNEFVAVKMEKYSMREEYKKGHFKPYIKKLLEHAEQVREIQNRYRDAPLKPGWCPWSPICEKCGKIITANVTGLKDGKVEYTCQDYQFETATATGCGHKGVDDPMRCNGKMMWKSEWASQWARWQVCSEGAGKEYQVPNSAFWVNAEICEQVLDFPKPEPIFYEHIMIDNQKMSASLGNVIYPKEWLDVAQPELLNYFYNKRLMKTRSFSWKDLPLLYKEYDDAARIVLGEKKLDNEKELHHYKRLFEISSLGKKYVPLPINFPHAALLAQIFIKKEDMIKALERIGLYDKKLDTQIFQMVARAKVWLEKYAPGETKFKLQETVPQGLQLSEKQRLVLHLVAGKVKEKKWTDKELHNEFYELCKAQGIPPQEFFKAAYKVLLNQERGPLLANFILTVGEKAVSLLAQA